MKYFYLLVALLLPYFSTAQIVTCNPPLPSDTSAVIITFDATQGNAALKGYTGDVYAHTGVNAWGNVIGDWGNNSNQPKLTRTGPNTYTLSIGPSILKYYGLPAGSIVNRLCFVFRNANASLQTSPDIFYPVYQSGLNLNVINPVLYYQVVDSLQKIPVNVSAIFNDSIFLYLNNVKIKSVKGQLLTDTIIATGSTVQQLVAVADSGIHSVSDTLYYQVQGRTNYVTTPAGLRDGINYINDSTVTFVLFAPYKKSVYLLGDFNNWIPGNEYLMNEDTTVIGNVFMYDHVGDNNGTPIHDSISVAKNNSRFWITLTHLIPGKQYIFQYLIDDSIRIADPYSEQISDPNFDVQISPAIYPNLIKYPTGKTTGIAGVIETGQTPYNWVINNFKKPNKNNLIIYELLIRDFTTNKDIKTVMDSLQYLQRLGVNAIELMPFSQFDGNDNWGYAPSFYFAPAKTYGTKNDYKAFIDACHQVGIAVIQDMVLSFSTNNSPLAQMYFANGKPNAQNPWYDVDDPNTAYYWGNVLNHNSPYTQALTDSITSFWMNEYKVDGFRFDFAKGWTNTFGEGSPYDISRINNLKLCANHMWQLNPDAYAILELFTANSEETLLSNYGMMIWGDMNPQYSQASMGYNGGSDFSSISYQFEGWNNPAEIGYMESHDEERIAYDDELSGNSGGIYNVKDTTTAISRMELCNTEFLTIPGPKMIWQFGELGYDVDINYNGRTGDKPVLWNYESDPRRQHLLNVVKSLIHLKTTYSVFSTSTYSIFGAGNIKQIELLGKDTSVEIIGNFDVYNNSYSMTFPSAGPWYEYFTGDTLKLSGSAYMFNLMPGEYRLYSNHVLKESQIVTAVNVINQPATINVFPNPFSDKLYFNANLPITNANIFDMAGREVLNQKGNSLNSINGAGLAEGMYFLSLQFSDGSSKKFKIMKN